MAKAPITICFACIKNAGRSQMAAAFLNHLVDPASCSAVSAGSAPADEVHPGARAGCTAACSAARFAVPCHGSQSRPPSRSALRATVPTKLTADLIKSNGVTLVFTMGCGDKCPYGEARHVRVQALVARACGCRRKALGCRPGADGVGA